MRLRFWQKPVEPTASEQRDTWLEWLKLDGRSESTITGYRQITDRFLKRWPELLMSEMTDDIITGFIEEANPASRQQRRGAFSNWFGYAARTKRIPRNPMQFVPTYRQVPQEPVECFTDAEIAVLEALPEPDGTLVSLLLGSGIRKAEARNLRVSSVDFDNDELHIVQGAKGGSSGVIPLSHSLARRLADYIEAERLGPDDFFWYCHPGGTPTRRHDRALSDGAMHKWWNRVIADAGIPYRKLHTTRHTNATVWRRRGLPIDDVSDVLRHADPRTTRRVYVHLKAIDIRRRMEEVAPEVMQ